MVTQNNDNFVYDEISAFYAHNSTLHIAKFVPNVGWVMFEHCHLSSDDAWAFFAFRYMGVFNLTDMYLLSDAPDDGNIYALVVAPCQQ